MPSIQLYRRVKRCCLPRYFRWIATLPPKLVTCTSPLTSTYYAPTLKPSFTSNYCSFHLVAVSSFNGHTAHQLRPHPAPDSHVHLPVPGKHNSTVLTQWPTFRQSAPSSCTLGITATSHSYVKVRSFMCTRPSFARSHGSFPPP